MYSKRFYSGFLQLLRKCESLPKKKKVGGIREYQGTRVCVCVCVCVCRGEREEMIRKLTKKRPFLQNPRPRSLRSPSHPKIPKSLIPIPSHLSLPTPPLLSFPLYFPTHTLKSSPFPERNPHGCIYHPPTANSRHLTTSEGTRVV